MMMKLVQEFQKVHILIAVVEDDEKADRLKKILAVGIVSGIGKRDNKKENTEKVSKEDSKEYEEIVSVLDKENTPESLEKFQRMKYSEERYKKLKDRVTWKQAKCSTQKSFKGHFKTHGKEFGEITQLQYQKLAADLLSVPVSENVLGYDTDTRRVRYDLTTETITIGKNYNNVQAEQKGGILL
ncbi:hypothetical protein [Ligilactobacillus salivarius]|uniref:hypothetical protein n=1 Tax=Ligilactobacillus salivarius TaxID=1624 RepID=UPI0024B98D61|nr:hypothetical protein [Ligilactobacillus salivarius]WHS11229.1 hypothetical protein O2U04_10375 [Ligilactobacillus salivarius]